MTRDIKIPTQCVTALEEYLQPDLFKSLCDPIRLSMVAYLATRREPVSVGVLTEFCGIDFSGVSRHLKILKNAEVVVAQKQGREVHYTLNSKNLISTLRGLADALEMCCPD